MQADVQNLSNFSLLKFVILLINYCSVIFKLKNRRQNNKYEYSNRVVYLQISN